ncbi:hydroxyisourate hydrolase [Marisediminicola sp. LYQ134]|uniref:hydroxyisourate hydrolase n=1 Tax=Marisediminicola sp. LYQ134 TaxID=3391061 RepID=UPI003983419A
MSHVTTHVLDTALGRPAVGVPVALSWRSDGTWVPLAIAATDADGRVSTLGPDALEPGRHRLIFDTGSYFASTGQAGFFPEVTLEFEVGGDEHYHVPLLLSPFAFSSYRGS